MKIPLHKSSYVHLIPSVAMPPQTLKRCWRGNSRLKGWMVVLAFLLQLAPNGFAQRGKAIKTLLEDVAKYVSLGSAVTTVAGAAGAFIPPPVSAKLDVGSREGVFSSKLVINLHNKTSDAVTGITLDYTVGGKSQRFVVGAVAPGQTKEFGWLQGAPMLQTGDALTVSCDDARSKTYHF